MKLLYSSYIKEPGQQVGFIGEDSGEKILLILRKHPITNIKWLFLSLVFFAAPFFVGWIVRFNGLDFLDFIPTPHRFIALTFWYLFTFAYFFTSFLIWFFSVYIISTKRIVDIDFYGFFHRSFSEALLTNIEDITHRVFGAAQVIFHYGTVDIQTAAENREIEFEDVPDPAKVQDFISDLTISLPHTHLHGRHENA